MWEAMQIAPFFDEKYVNFAQQKMCINRLTSSENCDKIGHTSAECGDLKNIFQKSEKSFENPLTNPTECDILFRLRKSVARILIIDN